MGIAARGTLRKDDDNVIVQCVVHAGASLDQNETRCWVRRLYAGLHGLRTVGWDAAISHNGTQRGAPATFRGGVDSWGETASLAPQPMYDRHPDQCDLQACATMRDRPRKVLGLPSRPITQPEHSRLEGRRALSQRTESP